MNLRYLQIIVPPGGFERGRLPELLCKVGVLQIPCSRGNDIDCWHGALPHLQRLLRQKCMRYYRMISGHCWRVP
jgi:hypothetical protein